MSTITMQSDQELPAIGLEWLLGSTGAVIDFSTGYTFTLKLVNATTLATALTKTTLITGAATAPNITIDFATGELAAITSSANGVLYNAILTARRTSDSKDRTFRPGAPFQIKLVTAPS